MSDRPIDIQIERLILLGIDPRDGERIADEARRELVRLITRHGLPPGWSPDGVAAPPDISVPAGATTARIGQTIASAIYRGGK